MDDKALQLADQTSIHWCDVAAKQEREIDSLRAELAAKDANAVALGAAIERRNTEIDRLSKRVAELDAHMTNEYARCEAWKARAEQAEAQLRHMHTFDDQHRGKIADLEAQLAEVKAERDAAYARIEELHQLLENSRSGYARVALDQSRK